MSKTHKFVAVKKLIVVIVSIFLLQSASSFVIAAGKDDKKPPIDITSESLEATGKDIIFIGNVHAIYGDMTIDADKVQLFYESENTGDEKNPEVKTIIATGNVELIEKARHAWAGKMVYERADELATLTENPRIKQETNTIAGDIIKIFFKEDRVEIKGNVKAIVNSTTVKD